MVCLYVDDWIYTESDIAVIEDFKMFIMVEFDMSNVGMIHYFIDLKVKWYVDGIFISQKKYVQDILDRFQMKNCNFVSILMEKGFKFIKELKGRNSGEFRVKK